LGWKRVGVDLRWGSEHCIISCIPEIGELDNTHSEADLVVVGDEIDVCEPFWLKTLLALLDKDHPLPLRDLSESWLWYNDGNTFPIFSFISQLLYNEPASAPVPKAKNTKNPSPILIQRSKTTTPKLGTVIISFQFGPCTLPHE
jgi:hypothetical protein